MARVVSAYHVGALSARRPGGGAQRHRGVEKGGLIGFGLVPYSVPEIRRVLNLLGQDEAHLAFHLQWSRWRQQHQWQAKQAHIQRRTRRLAIVSSAATALDRLPDSLVIAALPPLTPAHWERSARLLPPQRPPTGRPATAHRQILDGMLWVMHAGTSWRQMPKEYGPWQTIYHRFHDFNAGDARDSGSRFAAFCSPDHQLSL